MAEIKEGSKASARLIRKASHIASPNSDKGLWICIHLHALPLEVFSRGFQNPNQPTVVTEGARVAWLNQAADESGIRSGSSIDTAFTLAQRVVSFERDLDRELSALSQLAGWAYQFTPNVSMAPPFSLLLDALGCLKLFGGLSELTQLLLDGLAKMGYSARFGAANTPMAALLLAKAGLKSADFLQAPIPALEIESRTIESLVRLGMHSLGDVLKLPASGVRRRFGVYFADYLARLTGERPDSRKFVDPAPRFFSEIVFPSDVTNIESVVFPMRRLLSELAQFMRGRQLTTQHLTWKLDHRSQSSRSFNIFTASPENDPLLFFSLTQLQLEKITDIKELDSVSLKATQFQPLRRPTGDLFEGTRFEDKNGKVSESGGERKEEQLLNLLRARLGPRTCFGLSEANDHRPEKAWKTVRPDVRDYWEPDEPGVLLRPSLLLPEPLLLRTVEGDPWHQGPLQLMQGPERIDFGWWDGVSNDHAQHIVESNSESLRGVTSATAGESGQEPTRETHTTAASAGTRAGHTRSVERRPAEKRHVERHALAKPSVEEPSVQKPSTKKRAEKTGETAARKTRAANATVAASYADTKGADPSPEGYANRFSMRSSAIQRDYYIARQTNGVRLWVFKAGEAWFLHGLFA